MIPIIQNSFVSGELSPSFLGRTDKPQYRNGASTMRNYFVRYTGGASSRAGFAYCGMCKQGAPNPGSSGSIDIPPRDINFQFSINQGYALEFGELYMRIKSNGAYVVEATNAITAITSASPGVFTYTNTNYTLSNGDWIYITGVTGMTNFNGLTWIVQNVSGSTFTVTDLFGNAVDTTSFAGYLSGGTLARIYTVVSPYAAADLPYLKFTQNANLMNLVCWNQQTNTEYPPYTLERRGQTNWVFTQVSFAVAITPPATVSSTANASTTKNTWYSYVVTSIDSDNNESVASTNTDVFNNDISINAGSNVITWSHVSGAVQTNIYAATPIFTTSPFSNPGFIGAPYGFIGSSVGGQQFIDTNIIPDFTTTPPLHVNPFARGQILDVVPTSAGTVLGPVGFSISTSTGSGFNGTPVTQAGGLVGFVISDNGENYASTDTMTITGMSGASVTLTVGEHTGTYPGTVQYFQQRLAYANTINQPDTYFMSQPGLYNNFDSSLPTVDSDAIIGTPWAVQINGIQFMLPSIQGLLTFTGNGVWLVNGGSNVAITPSDENAQAQAQVGCSALLPPMYINLHVLYVQAKNNIVRDISFNFLYNTFVGSDITLFSNHLFLGYTLIQWAYSEEPYKVIWAARSDGQMLSLTYIKDQEIQGWSRHDTNGLFKGVTSVIEPPVDAVYTIVKRYITGSASVPAGTWAYYSERADNRQWSNVEDCFCVDAGLSYPMTFPAATLTPAAATGTNNISSTILVNGGSGYTSPIAIATDSSGEGTGATFTVSVSGGVITAVTPVTQGRDYTAGLTAITISDSTGSGAIVQPVITNEVLFTASSAVFNQIQYIYAANSGDGTVSVIDPRINETILNITVGSAPFGLAVTPNGDEVWVCNTTSGSVSIINAFSLEVIETISGITAASGIAITPDGVYAYVTQNTNNGKVYPITIASRAVGAAIALPAFARPSGICITPDGLNAYVADGVFNNSVHVIDILTNTVTNTIAVGGLPTDIVATPDSAYVWVTNLLDSTVSVIKTSDGSVASPITITGLPLGIAMAPDGLHAYVTSADTLGLVSVISTVSNAIVGIINVGRAANGIAISSDGTLIYIADSSSSNLYIISSANNDIIDTVSIGNGCAAVAVSSLDSSVSVGEIGDVIRIGGGKAVITEYISATEVMADIIEPITSVIPNDPNEMPIPANSGDWSISRPTMTVSGLNHLEGMTVTGLADGGVIVPTVVENGSITLQTAASAIVVGLPFRADLQAMPLEVPSATTNQGKRKNIQAVTLRVEASRGLQSGTNQPNSSWQQNNASIPWTNMKEIKERNNLITAGSSIPLFTGDTRILLPGDWNEQGMLAVSQIYPLPANILAVIPEVTVGDPST